MKKTKLKILEICPFSAGICGVWARVMQESLEFSKLGHEVCIFSSNIEKGTGNTACESENIDDLKINRFKSKSSLASKNVYSFNFAKAFQEYSPDIVITHLLHPHSFKALKLSKKYNIPCYLVTHAPFNVKRRFPLGMITSIYNSIKVKPRINYFEKIIAITKWEIPYLLNLGVKKEKIAYIPNGLPSQFFIQKKIKPHKDVLFLGRIAPVKNLESLIFAAKHLPQINFSIVGSAEEDYLINLKNIIKTEKIKNIRVFPPIYDLSKKISLIDNHKIFVLPSKREAMPQVLLEAMSRVKIVISSKTDGGKEIIQDRKNGFLFDIGDFQALAEIIAKNIKGNINIQKKASSDAKFYSWEKLIKSYLELFRRLR